MGKFDPAESVQSYTVCMTDRVTCLGGHLTYHVNKIKLKCEIMLTGVLPHLPEVLYLHVNGP